MARIQCPGVKWASAIETAFGATKERWSPATSSSQIGLTVSDVISRSSTSIEGSADEGREGRPAAAAGELQAPAPAGRGRDHRGVDGADAAGPAARAAEDLREGA